MQSAGSADFPLLASIHNLLLHPKQTLLTHQLKVKKKKIWKQEEDQKGLRSC